MLGDFKGANKMHLCKILITMSTIAIVLFLAVNVIENPLIVKVICVSVIYGAIRTVRRIWMSGKNDEENSNSNLSKYEKK